MGFFNKKNNKSTYNTNHTANAAVAKPEVKKTEVPKQSGSNTDIPEEARIELWEKVQLPELIMNEKVPAIQDNEKHNLFTRDYAKRRVVMSAYVYEVLTRNKRMDECIEHFLEQGKVDYITMCWMNNGLQAVNLQIRSQVSYYVPMLYEEEREGAVIKDDTVHYTKLALQYEQQQKEAKEEDAQEEVQHTMITEGKQMIFFTVKDQHEHQFIPLFDTEQQLRRIFPKDKFRACKMLYAEAREFGREFDGLLFQPKKTDFVLFNEQTQYYTGVTEYIRPNVDFTPFTKEEATIQDKIKKLQTLEYGKGEFNNYFAGILQSIGNQEELYIALNPKKIDKEEGISYPFMSNKDKNKNAIYMFSDLELAKKWTTQYEGFKYEGHDLIGKVEKKNAFASVFQIAIKLGITECMMDEGGAFCMFNIKQFMMANNMSEEIRFRMTKEEAEELVKKENKQIGIYFNAIPILGMEGKSTKEYYELRIK